MQLDERKIKEIEHSNRRRSIVKGYEYKTDTHRDYLNNTLIADSENFDQHFSNTKFYSICRSSFDYRDHCLFRDITNKVVLDYCCGNGEIALEMVKRGASRVHAIDISKVAIDNGKELANRERILDHCFFEVMDAENMIFCDNSFDIIHEYGALHHLDLDAAFKELFRVIKTGGRIVCTEALRHNPFIHWYRKRTPHLRTLWEVEHILGVPEIRSAAKYFGKIDIKFFHMAALAAVPFRHSSLFKPLLTFFEFLDVFVTRIPGLQNWSWVAVIVYSEPKK